MLGTHHLPAELERGVILVRPELPQAALARPSNAHTCCSLIFFPRSFGTGAVEPRATRRSSGTFRYSTEYDPMVRRTAPARRRAVCCLSSFVDARGRSSQRTPADVVASSFYSLVQEPRRGRRARDVAKRPDRDRGPVHRRRAVRGSPGSRTPASTSSTFPTARALTRFERPQRARHHQRARRGNRPMRQPAREWWKWGLPRTFEFAQFPRQQ